MPNLEYCSTSGLGFETGDQVLFLNSEGGFVISESSASEFGIPLMPAGRSFLRNLPRMELSTAGAVKLPAGAIRQLFRIATLIIQEAIGKPLLSLQTLGPTLFRI